MKEVRLRKIYYQFPILRLRCSCPSNSVFLSVVEGKGAEGSRIAVKVLNYPFPNVSGKTYLAAARTNNNPPIPKPNTIGNQAERIGVKTAFTPIELVMKENT